MTQRFPSKVALNEKVRGQLIAELNAVLASTIDVSLQVKRAHWNIKEPQVFARHELFDKLNVPLREHPDKSQNARRPWGDLCLWSWRATSTG